MNATNLTRLERVPHQATRAVVEALGGEAPRALYRAFDRMNATYFGSALGAPLLFITQTASPRALGDYIGRDVHGLRSRIRIAPKALARGERFAEDVLLHELVHAWQSEIDGDAEDGYKGHGPRFAAKCNEIGTALGLPPVGVKGRRGLPDCAQWPMCVRPAGYYPPAPARRQKVSKRPPRAPGKVDREPTGGEIGHDAVGTLGALVVEAIGVVESIPSPQREAFGLQDWLVKARDVLA